MSDNKPSKTAPAPEKQAPAKVVNINSAKCLSEDCKKSPARAGFCEEHFTWYKEGLLTSQGQKPRDFDKKYHDWQKRKKSA